MDFFNKLGKKASETYQITKEKTSKISGELKLKGKISDMKEKIDETYRQIGAIVYSQTKTGTEVSKDEIMAKCDEITLLFEEIEKSNLEILSLKNIKKCESCSGEIGENVEFCPKCGKEQPKPEVSKVEIKETEPETTKEAEVIKVENVEESTNTDSTNPNGEDSDKDTDGSDD